MFQFTPSRGGRHDATYYLFRSGVSIHALARRATKKSPQKALTEFCFNSRPRAEGDGIEGVIFVIDEGFNSRPRAEGD